MGILTREQFGMILKGLKVTYPSDWFIPDKDAAEIWYGMLNDLPYEALSLGTRKYMQTRTKEPTIADIRNAAKEFMHVENELSEQEAWSLVKNAAGNAYYHAEEEFSKLPPTIQKAVGSPANLKEWSMMDLDDFQTVQQSQFLRSYRAVVERSKEVDLLSPALQDRLQITSLKPDANKITEKDHAQIEEKSNEPQGKSHAMPPEVRKKFEAMKHRFLGEKGEEPE